MNKKMTLTQRNFDLSDYLKEYKKWLRENGVFNSDINEFGKTEKGLAILFCRCFNCYKKLKPLPFKNSRYYFDNLLGFGTDENGYLNGPFFATKRHGNHIDFIGNFKSGKLHGSCLHKLNNINSINLFKPAFYNEGEKISYRKYKELFNKKTDFKDDFFNGYVFDENQTRYVITPEIFSLFTKWEAETLENGNTVLCSQRDNSSIFIGKDLILNKFGFLKVPFDESEFKYNSLQMEEEIYKRIKFTPFTRHNFKESEGVYEGLKGYKILKVSDDKYIPFKEDNSNCFCTKPKSFSECIEEINKDYMTKYFKPTF